MTRNTHDAAEVLRRAAANHGDHDLVSVPRWAATAGALACDEVDTIDIQLDELREEMAKEHDKDLQNAAMDRAELYDALADDLKSLRDLIDNISEVTSDTDREGLFYDASCSITDLSDTLKALRNLD